MAARLTSLNELKGALLISTVETSLDVELTRVIEETSAECEGYTSRVFAYDDYANETHRGGGDTILTKQTPVDSAASFQLKANGATGTLSVYDAADYVVDYELGIVRLKGGLKFPTGVDGAAVSYAAGYVETTTPDGDVKVNVPGDLSRSVRQLCVARYRYQLGSISIEDLDAEEKRAYCVWRGYKRFW